MNLFISSKTNWCVEYENVSTTTFVMYEVEKFIEVNNLGLWQLKICALFVQQSLLEALEGESKFDFSMAEMNLKTLLEKTHNLIILSLGDKVLKQVLKEKTIVGLSMKLESLYMTKFFVNSLVLIQDE